MYNPNRHNQPGSQPPSPQQAPRPARSNRRGRLLIGPVVGAVVGATIAYAFSGGSSEPASPAPRPSAGVEQFTPTPETVTVTVTPSATESVTPSATPSATEASASPTGASLTNLQAAANFLGQTGCNVAGSPNDGIVTVGNKKFEQFNPDIVVDGTNPNVPGVERRIGVVVLGYGQDGKLTGQYFTDNKMSGNPGNTRSRVPATLAAGTHLQVAVVAEATDPKTNQSVTDVWACSGQGSELTYDGHGGMSGSDVQFAGFTGQGDMFTSQPGLPVFHLG